LELAPAAQSKGMQHLHSPFARRSAQLLANICHSVVYATTWGEATFATPSFLSLKSTPVVSSTKDGMSGGEEEGFNSHQSETDVKDIIWRQEMLELFGLLMRCACHVEESTVQRRMESAILDDNLGCCIDVHKV